MQTEPARAQALSYLKRRGGDYCRELPAGMTSRGAGAVFDCCCSDAFCVRKLFCTAFGFGWGRAPAAGFGAGGVLCASAGTEAVLIVATVRAVRIVASFIAKLPNGLVSIGFHRPVTGPVFVARMSPFAFTS